MILNAMLADGGSITSALHHSKISWFFWKRSIRLDSTEAIDDTTCRQQHSHYSQGNEQCHFQNQELLSPETLHSPANVIDAHAMSESAMLSVSIALSLFLCLSKRPHSRLFLICLSRLRKMLFGIGRVRLTRPGHDVKLTTITVTFFH